MVKRLTVADLGFLAVVLDDARHDAIGDDETVDRLAAALVGNGWDESEASEIAAALRGFKGPQQGRQVGDHWIEADVVVDLTGQSPRAVAVYYCDGESRVVQTRLFFIGA
jgi:hypothetical protein